MVCCWALCSVPLICLSVLVPLPHWLRYCRFIVTFFLKSLLNIASGFFCLFVFWPRGIPEQGPDLWPLRWKVMS